MSSDEEKLRDRRNSVLTTLLAGLLGGVLGAVVSLIGTHMQIRSQSEQSQIQIASQTDQARTQFLQTQRRALYSAFVSDEYELSRAKLSIANNFMGGTPVDLTDYRGSRAVADSSYKRLMLDISSVKLLGTPASVKYARAIGNIHVDLYRSSIAGSQRTASAVKSNVDWITNPIFAAQAPLDTQRRQFLTVARADLGVGP